jgi:hypothetical protein
LRIGGAAGAPAGDSRRIAGYGTGASARADHGQREL